MFFRNNYKQSSDEELMLFIKNGKEKAFEALYDRYAKQMHFFFYKMLNKDSDVANDFLQELFIKIVEKGSLFHPERKFKTWMYALASNLVKNEYRRIENSKTDKFSSHESFQFAENESITADIDLKIFKESLINYLDSIDENYKLIFILRYEEELSIKEIAEITYLPEGTIKSRLFYLLKKMTTEFKQFDPK